MMEYGDIIFFEPVSLQGELTAFFDGNGQFSHVGIYLGEQWGREWFIESDWGGVQVNWLDRSLRNFQFFQNNGDFTIRPIEELVAKLGTDYDWNHLAYYFFNRLFGTPLPVTDEQKFICSEFVNWVYKYQLIKQGTATPNNLYSALV